MTALLQSAVRKGSGSDQLWSIKEADCSLAIWQRPAMEGIDKIAEAARGDIRFDGSVDLIEHETRAALRANGYQNQPSMDMLVADIAQLARLFAEIMSTQRLQVRLEVVTTDSCRKFHADYVGARLITTYFGEGTQYLDTESAERVAQGLGPERIEQLAAGDVGIFKGKLGDGSPAIHRSPPIETSGSKRLLLVLSPCGQV